MCRLWVACSRIDANLHRSWILIDTRRAEHACFLIVEHGIIEIPFVDHAHAESPSFIAEDQGHLLDLKEIYGTFLPLQTFRIS